MKRLFPDPKASEVLREAIVRLNGDLGRTKLIKLVYLSDYFSRRATGKPITNFCYRLADHGPFDSAFYGTIEVLMQEEGFGETRYEEWDGYRYTVPDNPKPASVLEKGELEIVRRVIDKFGSLSLNKVLDIVYETEPMVEAKKSLKAGEALDMDSVNDQVTGDLGLDFMTYLESREALRRGKGISLDELIAAL